MTGYRKRLLDDLLSGGGFGNSNNAISYIGTLRDGDFSNNRHEGHIGANIAAISGYADAPLKERPNVILLHAGTNDMGSEQGADPAGAPARVTNLIYKIVAACPDAAVLVARIVHSNIDSPGRDQRNFDYNNEIYDIVANQRDQNRHVYLVDQYYQILPSDIRDGYHPTDAGYQKMGDVWVLALQQVNVMGWINQPVAGTSTTPTKSPCYGTLFWNKFGQVLNGAGLGKDYYPGQTCTAT